MPVLISLIYITAGIAVVGIVQSIILSFSQKKPAQFLPFSLFSLAIFAYQYTSALYYQATSVAEAASYLRWQVTFLCITIPLAVYHLSRLYDRRHKSTGILIAFVSAVCVLFFLVNLGSPYSLRFTTLHENAPLIMPWGERIAQFSGAASPWRHCLSLLNIVILLWSSWIAGSMLIRKRNVDSFLLLGMSLLFWFIAFYGILIDYGMIRSIYLPGFAFTIFALAMNIRYGLLLQQQTSDLQELNRKTQIITAELTASHDSLQQQTTALEQEISERRKSEEHIRKLSHGLEHSASAVLITDIAGTIEYINAKFISVTGFPPEEALGKNLRILKSESTPLQVYDNIWKTILNGQEWRGELLNRRKNGEVYWSIASISPLLNEQGMITHFIANVEDINDRKNAEVTIEKLAYYDPLTGLPNRRLLQDRLSMSMKRSHRLGSSVALLYLDLDRFKNVNDSLGHQAGDRLLQQMAERFTDLLRDDDLVCRLGGDEFAIILHDIKRDELAAQVAEKLISAAGTPVLIDGSEVVVTASIGIALYPKDAGDPDTLAKHADIALYHAKSEGKNTYRFYADELNRSSHERLGMEAALRHALERNELCLHYQPKVCLTAGKTMGVEALLRWQSSSYGMVSPIRFIPLAEETRLIIPIGAWVLRTACLQQVAWKQQGIDISMAVNLSAIQFNSPDLIDQIATIIDETGILPDRLELELTESALVGNPEAAARILEQLRALGVSIAIDDFGTGYSSLSYLKTFPINVLKIDRSFVRDLGHDSGDLAIARSIVDLAGNMGMKTVAEGVETQQQADMLIALGCTCLQGFHYARPIHAEEIAAFVTITRLPVTLSPETRGQR